jgi:hypothetical protein
MARRSARARPTRSRARRAKAGRRYPAEVARPSKRIARRAARRSSSPRRARARRDPAQGRRQGRHQGALRRAAAMGIRTVMITGDNPLTAAAIAAEAGVDDFLARPRPRRSSSASARTGRGPPRRHDRRRHQRRARARPGRRRRRDEHRHAGRAEAGNMVDLDSNPTKLIEIVEIGKQLLMTRGSLTTFSIANDVAKYFAIIPAMRSWPPSPPSRALNIMASRRPQSAILSRRHLQRADHRRAHPARAARRSRGSTSSGSTSPSMP